MSFVQHVEAPLPPMVGLKSSKFEDTERESSDVQQANLSFWATQPCVDTQSESLLDHVCKLEVPGWSAP